MPLLRHAPHFDLTQAVRLAREHYGIDATAAPLPSERDQNFLLTTRDGERFVLKIANGTEERALLDAQNAAMAHVAPLGLCPNVVPTREGDAVVREPDGHFVRLVTWLPGRPLSTLTSHPDALLEDLGRRLGQLDRALADFDHPAAHRDFHWDLARAFTVIDHHAPVVADPLLCGLVQRIAGYVHARDAARFPRLRRSVIHGDANDHNVITDDGGDRAGPCVTGFIDFGDFVHSYTVGDPAVAIAYAVLDKPDPLRAAATIVRGYNDAHRLTDDEASVLFGLIQLRLAVSVCVAAHQQRQRPSDEYLAISQAPIRRTLPLLAATHPDAAEEAFRAACDLAPRARRRPVTESDTLVRRRQRLGGNLSIGYEDPVKIERGWMQYLFDHHGRRYLDAYNNVPHVGHAHPRIVQAATDQMRAVNTNTRYLHDTLWQFAERLSATLPESLSICYFVNSGSEANELALRLARAHTRSRDVIVLDAAYHGNTTTLIDISPYKFSGPGGEGRSSWVHVAPVPDGYRGRYKRSDPEVGRKYADAVAEIVEDLRRRDVGLAAFIAETCPSVAGQIIPPPGYLQAAYQHVRAAGGVCICDEVQTAYGRLGTCFYAFEPQHVVPDIVVLGKPIGNGYPLGAVVTTREIAASFDNGMEFFSTFGGSTVSCAVGLTVLDVVEEEHLQAHALRVGERLLAGLLSLMSRHDIVGDVRGSGLFLGVELVRDRNTLEPATDAASFVINRMRREGILFGTDGPFHNVLKIRPPMPFNDDDADMLVTALDRVLTEVVR